MKPDKRIKTIGEKIRAIRKSKGLSQEEMAEGAGLHPTYISDIENGKVNASLLSYFMVATALEMPVVEIVDLQQGKLSSEIEKGIGELMSSFRSLPQKQQKLFLTTAKGLLAGIQNSK
jgi:transcriptional regulator with XRE-family HTH domain